MSELPPASAQAGDGITPHREPSPEAVAPGPLARPPTLRSGEWWPGGMGHPNSAGSQSGMRYAYFARAQRLAIERGGVITLYDTLDYELGGVAPSQSLSGRLRFTSPRGPVEVASLPAAAG